MKVLVNKAITIKKEHNQTNIPLSFTLDKPYSQLTINYHYSPSHASVEESYTLVKEALEKYFPSEKAITDKTIDAYSPIENLVTLSLSHNGEYLGARHTKEREQAISVSETEASLGFPAYKISEGDWEVQLNVHCVASERLTAFVTITVEGEA